MTDFFEHMHHDVGRPLRSSLGSGPRGNGIFLSNAQYEYENSGVYEIPIADFRTDQHGTKFLPRPGDVILVKTLLGHLSKANLLVVTALAEDQVVARSRAEWDIATQYETPDSSVTTDKILDNSVTPEKVSDSVVSSLGISQSLSVVKLSTHGGTFLVPSVDDDGHIDPDGIEDDSVPWSRLKQDTVPTMSATVKGLAKVGPGLDMTSDGKIQLSGGAIGPAVADWLDNHPEATTTVVDGSLTTAKYADGSVTDAKLATGANIISRTNFYDRNDLVDIENEFNRTSDVRRLKYKFGKADLGNGKITYDKSSAMTDYVPVKSSTSYTLLSKTYHYHIYVMEYDSDYNFISYIPTASLVTDPCTFTTTATTAFIIVRANQKSNYNWGDSLKNIVTYLFEGTATDIKAPTTYTTAHVDSMSITDKLPKFINGDRSGGTLNLDNPTFSTWITTERELNVFGGFLYGNGYTFNVDGTNYNTKAILPRSEHCRISIKKTAGGTTMSVKELANITAYIIHEEDPLEDSVQILHNSNQVDTNRNINNVQTGSSVVIKTRNHNIAIDYGRQPWYGRLGEFYRRNGVRYCDTIILTHYHDDHFGGFADAVSSGYLYIDGATAYLPDDVALHASGMPNPEYFQEQQQNILTILQNHNCTIVQLTSDQEIQLEDNVRLKFYNTNHYVYDSGEHKAMNYNDYSICFELFVDDTFVYNHTADLGPEGQKVMAKKLSKCNVLESMHHGWDNGTSQLDHGLYKDFILNVYPEVVVSLNGSEHIPGTSSPSSMDGMQSPMHSWCEKYCVPLYATNLNGYVNFLVNDGSYTLMDPKLANGQMPTAFISGETW